MCPIFLVFRTLTKIHFVFAVKTKEARPRDPDVTKTMFNKSFASKGAFPTTDIERLLSVDDKRRSVCLYVLVAQCSCPTTNVQSRAARLVSYVSCRASRTVLLVPYVSYRASHTVLLYVSAFLSSIELARYSPLEFVCMLRSCDSYVNNCVKCR